MRVTKSPSTGRPLTKLTVTASATFLLLLGPSAVASAGTIGVPNCGQVWGAGAAPLNNVFPDDDFVTSPNTRYGQGGALSRCTPSGQNGPQGPGMRATLYGTYSQAGGSRAVWRWQAAAGTRIERIAARYYVLGRPETASSGGYHYGDGSIWTNLMTDPVYVARNVERTNQWVGPKTFDFDAAASSGAATTWVDFSSGCGGSTGNVVCPADSSKTIADINVMGVQAIVRDDSNPQIANVSGDLATETMWKGTLSVSAQITDVGTGVYRLIFERRDASNVWAQVAATPLNPGDSKCRPIAATVWTQERVFGSSSPCRTNASGELDVDTTTLPEGQGTYRVLVEDATGNRSTLLGAAARTIDRTAPVVKHDGLPTSCVEGTTVNLMPDVADTNSGVGSVELTVKDKAGTRIPTAADGSIVCPAPSRGPLTVSVVATDKAGNSTTSSAPTTVAVLAKPVVQPPVVVPPEDKTPIGGNREVVTPPETTPPGVVPTIVAPVVPRTDSATNLLACVKQRVVLTEVYPSGGKDMLRGVADPKYVGQTVKIRYLATGSTVTAQVQPDGSFQRLAQAPKGKAAKGNGARYQASIGSDFSLPLKRSRRMYTDKPYRAAGGGGVYVAGSVTKPFQAGAKVTIKARSRTSCSDWKTVAVVKVSKSGKWGALLPLAGTSVVVRAETTVKKSKKSKKSLRTFTMPNPVQLVVG